MLGGCQVERGSGLRQTVRNGADDKWRLRKSLREGGQESCIRRAREEAWRLECAWPVGEAA